ncbi:MAG: LacI family transcriptional regulator [Marinilabiliales bacterium]|nr:MAG: LacI family transcriptional regulator [Marinilabiliales bacterium]
MAGNPVTLQDIADLLGLSRATVSRALKDHPDISDITKESVKKVAESLNYRPNLVASSLRHKKSKVIGLIVPQISYYFFPSVIHGIEKVVHKFGYNLLILQSNEEYEREKENLELLISNNVEGILASVARTTTNFNHFSRVIDYGVPIVFFDRVVKNLDADVVLLDDISGAYNSVKTLLEAGRRKIAICTGNLNLLISQNRLKGYKTALQEFGLPLHHEYIVSCEWPEEAEHETTELLNMTNPPDAIFAISDLTMSGVMKAIHRKGLKIPDDISVIGFCEDSFRTIYNPPLTAINPMGFEIGQKACEVLFERIGKNQFVRLDPRVIYLDGPLMEGGSV